jgi:hypothetical protein
MKRRFKNCKDCTEYILQFYNCDDCKVVKRNKENNKKSKNTGKVIHRLLIKNQF